MAWIPVAEQLPEDNVEILCVLNISWDELDLPRRAIFMARMFSDNRDRPLWLDYCDRVNLEESARGVTATVTHWQLMPPLPEQGEEPVPILSDSEWGTGWNPDYEIRDA